MSVWTGVHQKLDFFVWKSWLSVTVNKDIKLDENKGSCGTLVEITLRP